MKVIITGATGYVGEGVLLDCLRNEEVEKVLSISRRPTGLRHAKLEELIVSDFTSLQAGDERLVDYDALFFCAGITSIGTPLEEYLAISQTIPLHIASILPHREEMTFIYVSGAGTRINGVQAWQKIKGKTEQQLMTMGFKAAFGYRPCQMTPVCGQRTKQTAVQWAMSWLLPIGWLCGFSNTMKEVARSMVNVSKYGYKKSLIAPADIRSLARRGR